MISRQTADARAYDVIERVSVTCGIGIAQSCDDRLRARACALGADAVVATDESSVGNAAPAESAVMIRWKSLDAGVR